MKINAYLAAVPGEKMLTKLCNSPLHQVMMKIYRILPILLIKFQKVA